MKVSVSWVIIHLSSTEDDLHLEKSKITHLCLTVHVILTVTGQSQE